VILCSGKVYYDLVDYRAKQKLADVAIIRLEQLYPLHKKRLAELAKKYAGARVVWAQEESENNGAWTYIAPQLTEIFGLVPLEAILSGTPVVVADDSGCGEIVSRSGGGQVVPAGDVNALARAIAAILAAPSSSRASTLPAAGFIRAAFGDDVVCGGRLDLWTSAERALRAAGVGHVDRFDRCTACEPETFFSHRRDDGRTGRQGVIAYVAG
jgi:glycosyltransferase involved in cell wall biosynthesis